MKYSRFRDMVFQLINQYSIRGKPTGELDNDYEDLSERIPNLLTMAMGKISVDGKPIIGILDQSQLEQEGKLEERGGYTIITLPEDFQSMTGDGIPVTSHGRLIRVKGYHMVGDKLVMETRLMREAIALEYEKRPKEYRAILNEDLSEVELDGDMEQQMAAALFVAAMLMLDDDSFVYASLMNEFEDRVSSMRGRLSAEVFPVNDCMGAELLYM